eukprot:8074357-Pyramimonas_sp.AAC.1
MGRAYARSTRRGTGQTRAPGARISRPGGMSAAGNGQTHSERQELSAECRRDWRPRARGTPSMTRCSRTATAATSTTTWR